MTVNLDPTDQVLPPARYWSPWQPELLPWQLMIGPSAAPWRLQRQLIGRFESAGHLWPVIGWFAAAKHLWPAIGRSEAAWPPIGRSEAARLPIGRSGVAPVVGRRRRWRAGRERPCQTPPPAQRRRSRLPAVDGVCARGQVNRGQPRSTAVSSGQQGSGLQQRPGG